jgi:hypothetical protein
MDNLAQLEQASMGQFIIFLVGALFDGFVVRQGLAM